MDVQVEPKVDTNVAPTEEAEALMGKDALLELHGMRKMPSGDGGRKYPVWCRFCDKTIEAKARAKVWQHVRGQEHRSRRQAQLKLEDPNYRGGVKIAVRDTVQQATDLECTGLRLNGTFGRLTRLGSDLKPLWKDYTKYADMAAESAPAGKDTHSITHLVREDDWVIQHHKCRSEGGRKDVRVTGDGETACLQCISLANDQRYLSRISTFLYQMDMVRLLWFRMFSEDKVDGGIESVKTTAIYQRRSKTAYDNLFSLPLEKLYKMARATWWGKSAHKMVPALKEFWVWTVKPCLEGEPGTTLRDVQLQKILDYLRSDPQASTKDIMIVRSIACGEMRRHPAIQGVLCACMNRIHMLESGNKTFPSAHRHWACYVCL